MAFAAQYSAASLDQQVEEWMLSPLLNILFLMILIKTLLEVPLFYAGLLAMASALTLQKRLAASLRTACQKATLTIEHKGKKEGGRWIYFLFPIPVFFFVGAAAVTFEIFSESPHAATAAYSTVEEFADPGYAESEPLSIKQQAIVERYCANYSRKQLLDLEQDERFVADQIGKYKRDQRWLHVQSVLQHFAYVYAPKPSQKQISQHFCELWRELENEVKTRATSSASPTPE